MVQFQTWPVCIPTCGAHVEPWWSMGPGGIERSRRALPLYKIWDPSDLSSPLISCPQVKRFYRGQEMPFLFLHVNVSVKSTEGKIGGICWHSGGQMFDGMGWVMWGPRWCLNCLNSSPVSETLFWCSILLFDLIFRLCHVHCTITVLCQSLSLFLIISNVNNLFGVICICYSYCCQAPLHLFPIHSLVGRGNLSWKIPCLAKISAWPFASSVFNL